VLCCTSVATVYTEAGAGAAGPSGAGAALVLISQAGDRQWSCFLQSWALGVMHQTLAIRISIGTWSASGLYVVCISIWGAARHVPTYLLAFTARGQTGY
jgi:hypothetical protein